MLSIVVPHQHQHRRYAWDAGRAAASRGNRSQHGLDAGNHQEVPEGADADDGVGAFPSSIRSAGSPCRGPGAPRSAEPKASSRLYLMLAAEVMDGPSMALPMPCFDQWHIAHAMTCTLL